MRREIIGRQRVISGNKLSDGLKLAINTTLRGNFKFIKKKLNGNISKEGLYIYIYIKRLKYN
jgi:hypothetical protein